MQGGKHQTSRNVKIKRILWLTIKSFFVLFFNNCILFMRSSYNKTKTSKFYLELQMSLNRHHSKQSLILTGIVALSHAALT